MGRLLPTLACFSLLGLSSSGPAHRVKNITTSDLTVYLNSYINTASAGQRLVFGYNGQLWASDGTSSGTGPIATASSISSIDFLGSFDGIAYFQNRDDSHGAEVWRSDGTSSGTWLVRDLQPGSVGSYFGQMVPFRGELYFGVSFGTRQSALWKTNGTAAGTLPVAAIGPDVFGALAGRSVVFGDQLLFIGGSSRTPGRPYALYLTDGTDTGTSLLRDFAPHYYGTVCPMLCPTTGPGGLMLLDGVAYFAANDGATGLELWRSDGTPQGTRLVRDILPGPYYGLSNFEGFQILDHRLFFFAFDGNSQELWVSDGTEVGTHRASHLSANSQGGAGTRFGATSGIAPLGNAVFFPGFDLVLGAQVWKSDGSEAGTIPVTALPKGDSYPGEVTRIGDAVYFSNLSASGASQLWKIDAAGSVRLVASLGSRPWGLLRVGDALYFGASSTDGAFLWKSDGSLAGSAPLATLESAAEAASSSLQLLGELGNKLLFSAGPRNGPDRLWQTDGTEAGTSPIGNLLAGSPDVWQPVLTAASFDGALLFSGSDGVRGYRVWRTVGTEAGTVMLGDSSGPSDPCGFTTIGNTLYFGQRNTAGLWKTNGTSLSLIKNVQIGCSPGRSSLVELNGQGFFGASVSYFDYGLWKTDGTAPGTQEIWSGGVGRMAPYGGRLIFQGYAFGGFASLLVTEGQPGDAVSLGSLDNVMTLTGSDVGVFALVAPYNYPAALWKTDGTREGTVRLATWDQAVFTELVSVGREVFFAADDSAHGTELWVSDGTADGTHIVKDIARGPAPSSPKNLTAVGNVLVFSARDRLHGEELWRSDGTEAGTFRLQDIAPGPASSSPEGFLKAGSFLYFSADDGETGRELWALPLSALDPRPSERERETRVLPNRH